MTLSVNFSYKCKSSETDEPIMMKCYAVVVYYLSMCIKGKYSQSKYHKGDDSRGINMCEGQSIFFVI